MKGVVKKRQDSRGELASRSTIFTNLLLGNLLQCLSDIMNSREPGGKIHATSSFAFYFMSVNAATRWRGNWKQSSLL